MEAAGMRSERLLLDEESAFAEMREAAEKEQRSGSAAAAKREPKRKAVTFAVENVSPASGHIHCQYWPIVVEKKGF